MPFTVFAKTNNTLGKKDSYRATGRGRCRPQQGPQCGTINKGGHAGTRLPQALGRNEIVSSLPGGASIALVKINLRNVSVEISLKNVCLPSVCVNQLMSA